MRLRPSPALPWAPLVLMLAGLAVGCGDDERDAPGTFVDAEVDAGRDADAAAGDDAGDGEPADLELAPAAVEIEEGLAVAIDILRVDARLMFDIARGVVTAHAVVEFRTGGTQGLPVFDLRQNVLEAELDGEALDPERMPRRDLGGYPGSEMRVLLEELPPRSEHVLALSYELSTPDVLDPFDVYPPELAAGRASFAFNLADYTAAHFLEQWLPANLIFDRHALRVEIEVEGAREPHGIVSTGEVAALSEHHFEVRFPDTTAAHSPMLILAPESDLVRQTLSHLLPDGEEVAIHTATRAEAQVDLMAVGRMVADAMDEYVEVFGPYPHGERFTLYVDDGYGMEYDGGATVFFELDASAGAAGSMNPSERLVRHEVLHSWFGRGMQPVGQHHGWIDEAWVTYYTQEGGPPPPAPLLDEDFGKLAGEGPYYRDMSGDADPYSQGPLLLADIADRIGEPELTALFADFYRAHRKQRYDSAMLERALVCGSGDESIRELFARHVYAPGAEAAEAPTIACEARILGQD